jgi:hypothetical protein
MMNRIIVLSLAILCWASSSSAQECQNCEASCSEASTNELCCNAQCCLWDNPPIDTSEQSFSDPNGTPLGFATATMPRDESDDPMPCVVVNIPEQSRQTYIQLLIDSEANICVKDEDGCEGQVLCNPNGYKGVSSVKFEFDCGSCSAITAFYYRIHIEVLDAVDEYWCDNNNKTLPREYFNRDSIGFTPSDISQPTAFIGSAPHLLVAPALLVVSIVIAAFSTL